MKTLKTDIVQNWDVTTLERWKEEKLRGPLEKGAVSRKLNLYFCCRK